jgi:hypothetical protein
MRKNKFLTSLKYSMHYRTIKILRNIFSPINSFFDIQLLITGFIFFEGIEDSILLYLYGNLLGLESSWIIPGYGLFTAFFSLYSLITNKFRDISIWFIIIFFSSYFVCKFLDYIPPLLDEYNYGIYFYMLIITLFTRAKILSLKEWNHH